MPANRSARRVIAVALGIAAIFDLTGTAVYRTMRPVLPPGPPSDSTEDPFKAAMGMIMIAHREAIGHARNDSGVTLVA